MHKNSAFIGLSTLEERKNLFPRNFFVNFNISVDENTQETLSVLICESYICNDKYKIN